MGFCVGSLRKSHGKGSRRNFFGKRTEGPDEEAKLFLIDTTRQSTYLFKDNKIASNEDEIETTLEINTLHLKDFEFQLIDNFLDDSNIIKIDGIIGLGTINGKNSFMGQMKSNRLIKSKKVYIFPFSKAFSPK